MRSQLLPFVSVIIFFSLRCTDLSDPATEAKVTVYVHWGDMPIAGKKVEIVQTGESKSTDEKGRAEFSLLEGSYTVRVYNINRGGPSFLYVDFEIEVKSSETKTVDVVDCIACA